MSDRCHVASVLLDEIANLVAKSLITSDGSAPTGRWRLLETIREYALEKLAESGETEQIARRRAEFFRDLVRPAFVVAARTTPRGVQHATATAAANPPGIDNAALSLYQGVN